MQIYLPIAEMAVSTELIFLVSVFVGVLSGLFGIGGGFLTTPFLIFTGVPAAIAVGTQPTQIVANGTSGVLGHLRKGNVDMKMGGVMMAGSILGSLLGISIFRFLQQSGQIDFAIALLYAGLLLTIGTLMLSESLLSWLQRGKTIRKEFNTFTISSLIAALPLKMRFERSRLYISALVPAAVGFVGGMLAAVLGIGAGFLLVPAMIYIIGMPSLVVAGTSLFQIVFTTSFVGVLHAVTNQTLDVLLALILIIGGVIGAQMGVMFSRVVRGMAARIMLAALVLGVGLVLTVQLFVEPADLYSVVVR